MQILEKIGLNKKLSLLKLSTLVVPSVLIFTACNPTKYVPEGESLLDNNHISVNKEEVKQSDLVPYIKQYPNKKIFGRKFYLGLYNLSNLNKERWPHKWLREIGEEPVIYDSYSTIKSRQQIKSYVASKGYFDGHVTDTVKTTNRKSDVYYKIYLKTPYTVRNIIYEVADSNIKKLSDFDKLNCVISKGKPYDVDVIQSERSRFERFVKDHGFYSFSGDHISFRIDSTVGNRQVDIYYIIKNYTKIDTLNNITTVPHSIYRVNKIYIYPDFIPREALEKGLDYYENLDTVNYRGYYFISHEIKPQIKYDLIIQSLYLKPGSTFNVTNTEQSQAHLLALKTYRLVNINYAPYDSVVKKEWPELMINCNIQLTQLSQQSYKVELEGTNSAGNLGGALNLIYQNKNLFHGAELFSTKLKAAYEARSSQNGKLKSIQEYGFETSLRLPKFLFPVLDKESFVKKYNPSTTLIASYNYQDMPIFTRTMANATFGYNWKAGDYQEHFFNPLQANIVKLFKRDSTWYKTIEKSVYLFNGYRDVMILGGNYSYIFTDQKIKNSRDYWFLRVNAEATGNLLSLAGKFTGAKKRDGSYKIMGLPFAQYVRADMDLKYNYAFNDVSSIVYRGFVGVGIPYGNSNAIPFEKQYFGGGANGIRAWQVRSLGPGSYKSENDSSFLNLTGDIRIEANAEYRFKLFWKLQGAVFLDAGNIWTYKEDTNRLGSQFKLKSFYKDIAVGTGFGFRFDLGFVILRIDLGMKLRDPSITQGSKWIIMNRRYSFRKNPDDFTMVLGIGYPF
jgi:outer membrane protein assembly factor BamA